MGERHARATTSDLAAKHPSVGAHRNIGLFGFLDLVRTREPWTPMTPFNGSSDEMKAIGKYFRDHGLYTMILEQLDPHAPASAHHRGRAARPASTSSMPALDIADQAVTG